MASAAVALALHLAVWPAAAVALTPRQLAQATPPTPAAASSSIAPPAPATADPAPSSPQLAAATPSQPAAAPATEPTTPLWAASESDPKPPRFEFDGALLLALGQPLTPGLALRGRLRLVAGLWAHAGASVRGGSLTFEPQDAATAEGTSAGIREIPLELGLGYRIPLGDVVSLGLRGDAVVMSRRMTVANAEPQHRWLGVLRGGLEVRVRLYEQLGLALFGGVEGRLGRTEATLGGSRETFTPVAPYFELGPSLYF